MLFHSRNDGLNAVRGILNAVLLTVYLALGLALTVLLWAAISGGPR